MIELRTLGTVDLRDEASQRIGSVLQHSKRFALLAYLCASYPLRLHRRDTLVALLWPELDEAHARGALRHELSHLRGALGPDVLTAEGVEAVGVDGDRIWCDVAAFETALDAGCLLEALDLWRGEFLPGVHVPDSDFDRWLEGTRDHLTRRAMDGADRLRARAEGRGDRTGAVRWSRRCTELAPYDETAFRRLLWALDRVGDRAGALAAYNAFTTRLRQDLEVEVSSETRALADRIRGGGVIAGTAEDGFADGPPGGRPAPLGPDAGALSAAAPDPVLIAVRAAENLTGNARHDILGQRLTDRLVDGIAELAFVEVVVGDQVPGTTASVSTTLYPGSEEVEARTRLSALGESGRVVATPEPVLLTPHPTEEELDGVVARVLAAVVAHYDPRQPIAFVGGRPAVTPSWQAYHEFIQGSEAFGASRFEEAARRLRRAYEIDPRFLKAAIFASIAMAYAGDPAGADALATSAMAEVRSPSEYERHFGEWFLADLHGHRPEAYRAAMETIRLTRHPVLLVVAAREAIRMNRPGEALSLVSGIAWGAKRGWWRNSLEPIEGVAGAFHVLGRHHEELATALAGRSYHPEAPEPIRAEARARAALGEPEVALDLVEQALTVPPGLVSPADIAWTAAQELEVHGNADAAATARRDGLGWLAGRDRPSRADRLMEVRLLLEVGEAEQARQRLGALAPFEEIDSIGLAGMLSAAAGEATSACQAIAQLEALDNPYLSGRHLLLAAGIRAALAQPELAVEALRRAFAAGLPFGVELHALPALLPLAERRDFREMLRPRG